MPTGNVYTDEQMFDYLEKHCITDHLSKYTLHKPIWETYKQRMRKDPAFAAKIGELLAEADEWFERTGLDALHDKDFNNVMFAKLTNNKAFTKDHVTVEIEERIQELEDAQLVK